MTVQELKAQLSGYSPNAEVNIKITEIPDNDCMLSDIIGIVGATKTQLLKEGFNPSFFKKERQVYIETQIVS